MGRGGVLLDFHDFHPLYPGRFQVLGVGAQQPCIGDHTLVGLSFDHISYINKYRICRSPSIHSWLYVWLHMYIEIYRWMHILYIYDIYIYALNIHIFCMSVCLYHFSNQLDSPITVAARQLRAKMRGPTWYNTWLVWIHVEHISTVGMLQVDCWPGHMGRTVLVVLGSFKI